jgi:drug/metabolite transporter (DMT)-like permease
MRGDVPTVFEVFGASLAVAGIALILAPRLTRTEGLINARLIGDALAICAALLTAFYAYVYRGLAKNGTALESSSITFMTFSLGSVAMIAATCLIPTTISWEHLVALICLHSLASLYFARRFRVSRLPSHRNICRRW